MLYFIIFFVFLLGLIIGSFLNCLIWRLHKKESMLGRSYCPKCLKKIAWHDNIPILSFVFLMGKCRHCKKAISWQYPLVELTTGVLFVLAFVVNIQYPISNIHTISNIQYPLSNLSTFYFLLSTLKYWFVIAIMIIIFIYDLRWYLILDIITIPACVIVFLLNLLLGFSLWNLLISGIIGSSFFLFQFIVSKGKWIGGGDIRLGLLMGIILGWPQVILAIFLGYFIGSIVGIGLIISKKKHLGSQVPLGIFLSTSTIIVLFWGQEILNWYLNLIT
ncbi:prepilin peptidase [Candidatus Falkowbacteria bacterium]|nr:MAG: prepilin peptidase [Candidatus Falkowbacteria bacterium]